MKTKFNTDVLEVVEVVQIAALRIVDNLTVKKVGTVTLQVGNVDLSITTKVRPVRRVAKQAVVKNTRRKVTKRVTKKVTRRGRTARK